jgi:hypothetical protein
MENKSEPSPADKPSADLPFLDRKQWTTEQALEWALVRIRTSLDCGSFYDKAMSALQEAQLAAERTPPSAGERSFTPTVGERAVSFHEWWDALPDESFLAPSSLVKGHAWKAWNAALDAHAVAQSAKERRSTALPIGWSAKLVYKEPRVYEIQTPFGVRVAQEDPSMPNILFELVHAAVTSNAPTIEQMVDRFLSWKLPEDFHPDAGISFKPEYNVEYNAKLGIPPARHQPIGTNLLTATQAKAMVEHMFGSVGPTGVKP